MVVLQGLQEPQGFRREAGCAILARPEPLHRPERGVPIRLAEPGYVR